MDRSLAIVHFTLGTVLAQLGDLDRAEKAFRNAYANTETNITVRTEERALHGWQLFPDLLPEAKRSVAAISDFIIQHIG
ncbi:MAG: hypothetical protein ACO2ZL_09630 [Flavobacteriales bacterium]